MLLTTHLRRFCLLLYFVRLSVHTLRAVVLNPLFAVVCTAAVAAAAAATAGGSTGALGGTTPLPGRRPLLYQTSSQLGVEATSRLSITSPTMVLHLIHPIEETKKSHILVIPLVEKKA